MTTTTGTIVTPTSAVVSIDADPPLKLWPRQLWHITHVPGTSNFEVRCWDHDYITREYHEAPWRLVAAGIAGARRLVPAGFVIADDEGLEGEWYRRNLAGSRAGAGAPMEAA